MARMLSKPAQGLLAQANNRRLDGFTIVELLIVIAAIAILAAIVYVSYGGIQTSAAEAALKSDLDQAKSLLELDHYSDRSYPSKKEDANNGAGLQASSGTVFEYSLVGKSYCLTASSEAAKTSFYVEGAHGTITEGVCSGHVGYAGGDSDHPEMVTTFAGSGAIGWGNGGFSDGAGTTSARFNVPLGIAIDSSKNVYIADRDNYRIRKITPSGNVTTLAGSTQGYADGTGSAAKFDSPTSIAVDSFGNLYVTDWGINRIRKITPSGVVTTLAGSGWTGDADGTGVNAEFSNPRGIAIDSSNILYVGDNGNGRIRKITPSGVVTTLAGSTSGYVDGTGSAAKFASPSSLTVDNSGNVYVADTTNHRIRKITPSGVVTTLAGSTSGHVDGTGSAAKFSYPAGITVDSSGVLYVCDDDTVIRKITPSGVVTTLAGSTSGYVDGAISSALFDGVTDIAINSSGVIYVVDTSNNRIRKIE